MHTVTTTSYTYDSSGRLSQTVVNVHETEYDPAFAQGPAQPAEPIKEAEPTYALPRCYCQVCLARSV